VTVTGDNVEKIIKSLEKTRGWTWEDFTCDLMKPMIDGKLWLIEETQFPFFKSRFSEKIWKAFQQMHNLPEPKKAPMVRTPTFDEATTWLDEVKSSVDLAMKLARIRAADMPVREQIALLVDVTSPLLKMDMFEDALRKYENEHPSEKNRKRRFE
jgi:hypothetical protein